MAVSIPTIRKAAEAIRQQYNITPEESLRIIATLRGDSENIYAILAGDFSSIAEEITRITPDKITLSEKVHPKQGQPEKITPSQAEQIPPEKITQITLADGEHPQKITPEKDTKRKAKKTTKNQITPRQRTTIPVVTGEILADGDELPPDFPEIINGWLEDFKIQNNFEDLAKIAGLQWRAVCLYIGDCIQASGVLRDKQRERTHGGKIYNPNRVAALIPIWERLTALYKHVPLTGDYIAFTGVSDEWFYDSRGILTSGRVDLAQKVRAIEERALAAALADSRENPTGRIYYTKARLGWRETTEIIHTSAKEAATAAALPVFDGENGLLTDKQP